MKKSQYVTIPELAGILGISRVAVYRKVRKGQIKAVRIGRNYAIPRTYLTDILGEALNREDKKQIDDAIKKTVKDYGEVLRLLGSE
jgi:excisionase family DNA binding protein